MPGYLLDFRHNTSQPEEPGAVRIVGPDVGVKAEDIGGTGVYFEITEPFGSSSIGAFVDQDHYGITQIQWNHYFLSNSTSKGAATLGGFPPFVSGTIKFWGVQTNAGRHRILRINGEPYQNDNPGGTTPLTPSEPTEAPFTADSEGKVYLEFDYVSATAAWGGLGFHFEEGPKIVEVNADENIASYGEQCEMTVTGFESSILWATIAGISCTGVSNNGFTMPALVDETTVPMFGSRQLTVGNDDESASLNIDVVAPEGFRAVVLGDDLNNSNTGTIFDFVPAAKEGDAIFSESTLVVDNKGNIIDAPAGVYNCWHLSVDENDPSVAVARSFFVTLGGGPDPDDRPDDVRFNTVNKADLNTEYESNTVEITGINVTVDVTISGGEYRIDDGEWGSAAGTIQNGQEIQLRANSPADKNQTTTVTINVGSATFKWRIRTERDSGGVSQIPGMQVPTMRGLS